MRLKLVLNNVDRVIGSAQHASPGQSSGSSGERLDTFVMEDNSQGNAMPSQLGAPPTQTSADVNNQSLYEFNESTLQSPNPIQLSPTQKLCLSTLLRYDPDSYSVFTDAPREKRCIWTRDVGSCTQPHNGTLHIPFCHDHSSTVDAIKWAITHHTGFIPVWALLYVVHDLQKDRDDGSYRPPYSPRPVKESTPRRRGQNACERCRHSRIRCKGSLTTADGGCTPCSHCEGVRLPCSLYRDSAAAITPGESGQGDGAAELFPLYPRLAQAEGSQPNVASPVAQFKRPGGYGPGLQAARDESQSTPSTVRAE